MSQVLTLWRKVGGIPLVGTRVFSFAFARKAPYFGSVHPRFTVIEPDHAELVVPDRRSVHNHLGTVHAIALCNGLEAAMGALAEATIPAGKRWIPKGMEVAYTAKARGDITCIAETDAAQWASEDPDLPVRVRGVDRDGTVVIQGEIRLWVTWRAEASAQVGAQVGAEVSDGSATPAGRSRPRQPAAERG
jgi:acyl-coenzyme A thioesterase PaaI-like protein